VSHPFSRGAAPKRSRRFRASTSPNASPKGGLSRDRELELADRIQAGDWLARNELVVANLPLVGYFVKKFCLIGVIGVDHDDLIQEGNAGLIRAADSFDPRAHRTRFSTYAGWWIYSRVRAYILNHGSTIRTPIYVFERGLADELRPRLQPHNMGLVNDRSSAPVDQLIDNEDRVDLFSALARLSGEQRSLLNWYVSDFPNESPARRKSEATTARVNAARRLLARVRAQLNPEGAICA
jgi:RNA polymerase sigma factor (sigma-70 family)